MPVQCNNFPVVSAAAASPRVAVTPISFCCSQSGGERIAGLRISVNVSEREVKSQAL